MENLFIENLIIQAIFWLIWVLIGVLLFELPSMFNLILGQHPQPNAHIKLVQGIGGSTLAVGNGIDHFKWFALAMHDRFEINDFIIDYLYVCTCRSPNISRTFELINSLH